MRVWCETMSKVAERSSSIRAAVWPWSRRVRMSSVVASRAVSVLPLLQKPGCEESRRLWVSKYSDSWELIAFSMTLAGNGNREMGL